MNGDDPFSDIKHLLDPDDPADPFDRLDSEFKQTYGRPLTFTGLDTDTHVRLHGSGQARDIRVRDLNGDQIKFILNRGPELGLNLRDYSTAKPHTTKTGVRITGPHIHGERSKSNKKSSGSDDPFSDIRHLLEQPGTESDNVPRPTSGASFAGLEDLLEAPAVSFTAPPANVSGVQPVVGGPPIRTPQMTTEDVQGQATGEQSPAETDLQERIAASREPGYQESVDAYHRQTEEMAKRAQAQPVAPESPEEPTEFQRAFRERRAQPQQTAQPTQFQVAFRERRARKGATETPDETVEFLRSLDPTSSKPRKPVDETPISVLTGKPVTPGLLSQQSGIMRGRVKPGEAPHEAFDRAITPGPLTDIPKSIVQGAVNAGLDIPAYLADIAGESPAKRAVSGFIEDIRSTVKRALPIEKPESLLTAELPGAAGSSLPTVAASMLAPEAIALRVVAALGAAQNGHQIYQEAIAAGKSHPEALRASIPAALAGTTQRYGLGSLGVKVGKQTVGQLLKHELLEEGGQEGTITFLNNAIALGYFDPTRELDRDVLKNALMGAVIGPVIAGGAHVAKGRPTVRPAEEQYANDTDSIRTAVQLERPGEREVREGAEEVSRANVGQVERGAKPANEGAPRKVDIETAADEAAQSPTNARPEPTTPQVKAGNYKKGHVKVAGLDVSIENPVGSIRRGVDESGKPWERTMATHYGYVRRTQGNDGEQVDVHLRPRADADYSGPVFVVNQTKPDGTFDEHKAMLGWHTEAAAEEAYLSNYQPGWDRVDSITRFDNPVEFRAWLDSGNLKAPAKGGETSREEGNETVSTSGAKVDAREARRQPDAREDIREEGQVLTPKGAAPVKTGKVVAEEPARVAGVQGIVKRARENERRAITEGAVDQATGLQSKNSWVKARPRIDADPAQEVAVLDVNDLKKFNDSIGHQAGDDYLAHVGKVTLEEAEKAGISPRQVFRSGGDEVVIAAPKGKAQALVARIKERVAEFERKGIKGSIAGGVGQATKVADAMMYRDKQKMKEAAARTAIVKQATAPAIEKAQGRVEMVSLLKKGFSRESIVKMKPAERTKYAGMETPRLVYRARSAGDTGVKTGSKSQATSSLAKAREYAVSRTSAKDVGGKQQEVVAIDVTKLPRGSYEFAPAPDGQLWFNTKIDISESAVTVERRGRERAPGEKKPEAKPAKPRDAFAAAVKARLPQKLFQKGRLSQEDAQEAYDKADAEFRTVSQAYREAARAYRAREIGDTEFLKAKSALTETSAKFDAAETALINSPKPKPAKAESTQGRLFQKNSTPLLTAIRRAGGIDPNTQEGKDIARYFSRREGGQGLMIQGGAKVDQLVRALRDEEGFPFTEEDDPNHSPVSELLAAMQREAEGKPFRSYDDVATDFENEADQYFAEEQGIANVEDFRIINSLASEAWFELHAKVINENTEPTEAEVARFRTLSNAIKLSPGAIEDFIEAGRVGRSESATEFFTEDDRNAVALERAKIEAEAESRLSDYARIPLPVEVKAPLLEIARKFVRDKRTDYDALAQEYQDILGDDFILVADHLPTIFAHVAPAEQEVAQNVTELKAIVVDPSNAADLEGGPLTESELKWIAERRRRDAEFEQSRKVARETGGGEAPGKGSGVKSSTSARKSSRVAEKITRPTTATDRAEFKAALIKNWGYLEEVAHRASEIMEALASQYAVDAKASDPKVDTASAKRSVYERVKIASGPATGETLQQSADAPAFYSQLQRTLESQAQPRFTPEQLQAVLTKAGVKPDEMKWTGFDDFLAGKRAKGERVTKQEALEFARQNAVKVREVTKGERIIPEATHAKIEFSDGSGTDIELRHDADGRFRWYTAKGEDTELSASTVDKARVLAEQAWPNAITFEEEGRFESPSPTKFEQFQISGGENYRELLLTLPVKPVDYAARKGSALSPLEKYATERLAPENTFKSSHFDEANVLAHVRFNERKSLDGKRVLFIEEIQSDWHQKGRREGYAGQGRTVVKNPYNGLWAIRGADGLADSSIRQGPQGTGWSRETDANYALRLADADKVPDAPFKTTWPDLAMKRAIRWAAENGFDKVAWTTGEMQADRYDLSKQVKNISWAANRDGSDKTVSVVPISGNDIEFRVLPDGKVRSIGGGSLGSEFDGKHITDVVGKDIGDRIVAERSGELRGEGLKVGGKGMKGFYDKILPSVAAKLGKKFGAKVGETKIDTGRVHIQERGELPEGYAVRQRPGAANQWQVVGPDGNAVMPLQGDFTPENAIRSALTLLPIRGEKNPEAVHSIDITPEMRASALQGQPLFQDAFGATSFTKTGEAVIHGFQANPSTAPHELVHAVLPLIADLANQPNAPATLKIAVRDLVTAGGFKDTAEYLRQHQAWISDAASAEDKASYNDGSEKIARGFEGYLNEGKAPTKALESAFAKFKEWLSKIYRHIREDMQLTDQQRRAWDRLLGSEREKAASKIDEQEHWNWGRSSFASPRVETNFRAIVREAAVDSGGQHKIPVSRQAHLERVGNLAPDLLPEIKGLRENLIVSREVFTAAAEYAQTLTRQAQELRDLITPSTLPDEQMRLEDKIAALEHDATEVMSHTIGVRSEFGRNLALLAAQKTDQLSPERVLAYGQSLAEQRGMDKTSQTWKTRARKLVGLSNGMQAAEKQKKKLERERKKIEDGKGKKEPRKPWQTVMLEGLQSQAAEAQARLAAQYGARLEQADDTQLFQKRDIPTAANDIAAILAARIAEEGQKKTGTDLTRMVEELRSSFPDIVNEYEPQIKEAADSMLREARRSALLAAARDPQQKVSVRQQLAKDVSDAKKVENEADRQLATKTRQMDAMFERDAAQAAKEATEKWDRANADWQRMMDESQKAAEEAEKQAVALGEKQKAAGETAEQKRLREEWINEAKDRKENWLAGEQEFAHQQRAAIVDEARRIKRAEIEAEKDRLRGIAEEAREQTRASRAAIVEAARIEGRWDYPVTQAAENARANLADPNHAPTVEELGAVMAEKSLQDGMTPQRLHREMSDYGTPYTENARKVRDRAASMKADARENFAQRRLEERAAGQATGATNIAGQRQARADYQTWEARRLEEITQELAYQNRIIRTNRRDMARELARLQKVSALDGTLDLIGLPRSLASSVDLPHLRQGLPTLMNHPAVWFESLIKSTSTWTAAQMEARLDEMEASPLADLARLSGLKQSGLESRRAPLSRLAREEQFQNRFTEKFPHVRVSQRQYTTGMDVMRLKTFELHADKLLAEYPPAAHPEIYSELARIVNIMTGVGDIGSATQFAPFLNHFLFATRFMVSRFQLLSMLRAPLHYRGQPPAIRKIATQEAWGYVGKMSLLFGTAAALGLTSLDPDDDDFLKFQIPGTSQKWDFTGGLGGYVGTLFKLARGAYRAGTGERSFKGDSFGDTAERFVRSKLAPAPATLWDWKTGRTFIGEPFSWKSKAVDLAVPMMAGELYDAIKTDGARGAVMIPYALMGGNVSAYRSRKMPHRTGSQAERYATGMLRERMGEKPETTEDYKRRTLITELAVAMKTENQRNVARITQEIEKNGGPLSAKEKESVEDRVEKTPLQRAYKYLGTAEKQAVLDVATPEEALSLEKNAGSITDRLKDLIESPEYKAMNETQRKNALKQTAEGARKGLPEAETEFVIDRTEAREGVIEKLKARDDFKALSEDDQDSVVRSVNGLFQKLSIKKEDHGKPDVIRRKTRLLDDLLRRGTFEREIDRILREQQRKAA